MSRSKFQALDKGAEREISVVHSVFVRRLSNSTPRVRKALARTVIPNDRHLEWLYSVLQCEGMSTPAQTPVPATSRQLLRHTLATLAYRGGKALRGASGEFAGFHASETTRTPVQILAHMGDVLDWALSMAKGEQVWRDSTQRPWAAEADRFFASLKAFDAYLASDSPLNAPAEKLFQGPVADALTHVGQLMMLRRIAGAPHRGENYFVADIVTGRVGSEQSAPVREFD